jgi:hypothetical protein
MIVEFGMSPSSCTRISAQAEEDDDDPDSVFDT